MTTCTVYYGFQEPLHAVGKHQCRMLEFAYYHRGWHSMAKDRSTKRAADALQAKGYIEIVGDQFRFNPHQIA